MHDVCPPDAPDRYPLGRSDAESRRLVLQNQIYGPLTRQFLASTGITRGMRVLDVGSGAGDVALLLADLVGPQGCVVGVDMNSEILDFARQRVATAGWGNVDFHRVDLARLDRDHVAGIDDGGDFDAVVGRWILMYLDEPSALIRALSARVRTGGIVAFQESDLSQPIRAYPEAPHHDALAQLMSVEVASPELEMGPKLFRMFLGAGLPPPEMRIDTPAGGGLNWPGYAYVAATAQSLRHFLAEANGLRSEDLALDTLESRLRHETLTRDGIQILAPVYGAWARASGCRAVR